MEKKRRGDKKGGERTRKYILYFYSHDQSWRKYEWRTQVAGSLHATVEFLPK